MNTALILALSSLCGLMIGLAVTRGGKEREAYYHSAAKLCSHIISNISFKSDKISNILDKAEVESPLLYKNICEYKQYILGGEPIFSKNRLSEVETEEIKNFFLRLGRSDIETQIAELKKSEEEFTQKYLSIKQKNDKQGNMYVKLGFLLGLLVGILLI